MLDDQIIIISEVKGEPKVALREIQRPPKSSAGAGSVAPQLSVLTDPRVRLCLSLSMPSKLTRKHSLTPVDPGPLPMNFTGTKDRPCHGMDAGSQRMPSKPGPAMCATRCSQK